MRVFRMLIVFVAMGSFVFGCGPQETTSVEAAKTSSRKATPEPVKTAPQPAPRKEAPVKPAPAKASPPKPAAAPAQQVVKAWDFTQLPTDKWTDVTFPGNAKQKWPGGAAFTLWNDGFGPQIQKLDIDAASVSAIRIELAVRRTKDGKEKTPVVLERIKALWAGPKDVGKGKQPYAKTRVVEFGPDNPKTPLVWTAWLKGVESWKGEIARLGFFLDLPEALKEGGKDRYHIVVKKIELLK